MELVRSGKPVATIVVGKKASAPERLAASELQRYLSQMSGARLPIATRLPQGRRPAVLVGRQAVEDAGPQAVRAAMLDQVRGDGYVIATISQDPPRMALAGREPRATLYAVYDFLDVSLGCGFFCDGDNVPRRPDVEALAVSLVSNPVFGERTYWLPLSVYGPKRFQAALWNLEDWKRFLRWVVKKRYNSVAIAFNGSTRAWGVAFDKAFPEAAKHRKEIRPPRNQAEKLRYTARIGWGLAPERITSTLKQAMDFGRKALGLTFTYVLTYGEFEDSLRAAHPKLKWRPELPPDYPGVAGGVRFLSVAEPQGRELQRKLWQAIIETYGTDHLYVLCSQPPPGPVAVPGKAESATVPALEVMRRVDPKARVLVPTWEADLWGKTDQEKQRFLRELPKGIEVLYYQPSFTQDLLYVHTKRFTGRDFAYACPWSAGPGHDLVEDSSFWMLRNVFRHWQFSNPRPLAVGFWNWNDVRGTNVMMEELTAEFAWTGAYVWRGEGASTNRIVRRYLARRYGQAVVFSMAEAYKQAFRGTPRTSVNYRDYVRWGTNGAPGIASARSAVALMLATATQASQSPFYERDLADIGRNYLHQRIQRLVFRVLALVRDAKRAAQTGGYSQQARKQALQELKSTAEELKRTHKALTRLIATRADMCLDDAILERPRAPTSSSPGPSASNRAASSPRVTSSPTPSNTTNASRPSKSNTSSTMPAANSRPRRPSPSPRGRPSSTTAWTTTSKTPPRPPTPRRPRRNPHPVSSAKSWRPANKPCDPDGQTAGPAGPLVSGLVHGACGGPGAPPAKCRFPLTLDPDPPRDYKGRRKEPR